MSLSKKISRKRFRKISSVLFIVAACIPFLMDFFFSMSDNDWKGFLGNYFGGIFTLIAVEVSTWSAYALQERNEAEHARDTLDHKAEICKILKQQEKIRKDEKMQTIAMKVAEAFSKFSVNMCNYYENYRLKRLGEKYNEKVMRDSKTEARKNVIMLQVLIGNDENGKELVNAVDSLYKNTDNEDFDYNEFDSDMNSTIQIVETYFSDKNEYI